MRANSLTRPSSQSFIIREKTSPRILILCNVKSVLWARQRVRTKSPLYFLFALCNGQYSSFTVKRYLHRLHVAFFCGGHFYTRARNICYCVAQPGCIHFSKNRSKLFFHTIPNICQIIPAHKNHTQRDQKYNCPVGWTALKPKHLLRYSRELLTFELLSYSIVLFIRNLEVVEIIDYVSLCISVIVKNS